jgi:hypothetical protein
MKPYSPATNKGRTIAMEVVQIRHYAHPAIRGAGAKAIRHAARQQDRRLAMQDLVLHDAS